MALTPSMAKKYGPLDRWLLPDDEVDIVSKILQS
jgi:hypothetical protein